MEPVEQFELIQGVDTRALTRHLREVGAMRVGVFSGAAAERPVDDLLARVRTSPEMLGASLADEVSADSEYVIAAVGPRRFTVAAVDLGIKGTTPRHMSERGIEVHVLPSTTTPERMLEIVKEEGPPMGKLLRAARIEPQ